MMPWNQMSSYDSQCVYGREALGYLSYGAVARRMTSSFSTTHQSHRSGIDVTARPPNYIAALTTRKPIPHYYLSISGE